MNKKVTLRGRKYDPMSIFKLEDWIFRPRYYCGFPVSLQRGVWLDKIVKTAKELIDNLNLVKKIATVESNDEKYWSTKYFYLTIRRDVEEDRSEKIVLIFEWVARQNKWRTPRFCFSASLGSNHFTPTAATGKPLQLARFAELILRTCSELSPVDNLEPRL